MTHRNEAAADGRYSIAQEWTGEATPQYVVRFCGDWVGSRPSKYAAKRLRDAHHANRQATLTGE